MTRLVALTHALTMILAAGYIALASLESDFASAWSVVWVLTILVLQAVNLCAAMNHRRHG